MPTIKSQLADFSYFLAIAKHRSFRLAGLDLGITPSALSHALKGLEARLGVRLIHRTSRSVTLTEAGLELRDAIAGPIGQIDEAVERLNLHRDSPAGRIRLSVPADAAPTLLAPVLGEFADLYPDVSVELVADDQMVDIVAEGYDAGIRHGGTVPEDMVAQRLSADLRWVVAGSPAYFERFGIPLTPADLLHHRCIAGRSGDRRIYKWEFEGPDGEFSLSVPSPFIISEGRALAAMAIEGAGLMYGVEPIFLPHVETGALRIVLDDWAARGAGYYIYYPGRRQVPVGLKLLIELIRKRRPLGF